MGFFDKLKAGLTRTRNNMVTGVNRVFTTYDLLEDDFYDELEEIHENPVKSGPEGYYVALDDPTAERPF